MGELRELSGLAASRSQPGIYWAHNDSGDTPRLFAMRLDGQVAQVFTLKGAEHVDWEELGLGPCGAGTCVVLGDIGDNRRTRREVVLYRVAEPVVGGPSAIEAERFAFTYPDGPHNAEALIVAPGDVVYVLTKEPGGVKSVVFRLRLNVPTQVAERVASLRFPREGDAPITAASLSPCGDRIAVRLYNRLVLLEVPPGGGLEDAFGQEPLEVPAASELQAEAVTFGPDGKTLVTTSEQPMGFAAPIWQSGCAQGR